MIDGPSIWVRIPILYLMALWICMVVVAIRLWHRLDFNSRKHLGRLAGALEKLRLDDKVSLQAFAREFKEQVPEAGLREWATLSGSDSQEAYRAVVRRSDSLFRFRAEEIRLMIAALRGGTVLGLGLSALVALIDLMNLLRHVQLVDFGVRTFYLHELENVGASLAATALVGLQCLVVMMHFSHRLARRRNHWQHFVSRALDE
jgi:hypothetical protein